MLQVNLKKLLSETNITIKELSKKSNVPLRTVQKYYDNNVKIIRNETVLKLCKALNCEVEDLLI